MAKGYAEFYLLTTLCQRYSHTDCYTTTQLFTKEGHRNLQLDPSSVVAKLRLDVSPCRVLLLKESPDSRFVPSTDPSLCRPSLPLLRTTLQLLCIVVTRVLRPQAPIVAADHTDAEHLIPLVDSVSKTLWQGSDQSRDLLEHVKAYPVFLPLATFRCSKPEVVWSDPLGKSQPQRCEAGREGKRNRVLQE